jgi:hypothetical protein
MKLQIITSDYHKWRGFPGRIRLRWLAHAIYMRSHSSLVLVSPGCSVLNFDTYITSESVWQYAGRYR